MIDQSLRKFPRDTKKQRRTILIQMDAVFDDVQDNVNIRKNYHQKSHHDGVRSDFVSLAASLSAVSLEAMQLTEVWKR